MSPSARPSIPCHAMHDCLLRSAVQYQLARPSYHRRRRRRRRRRPWSQVVEPQPVSIESRPLFFARAVGACPWPLQACSPGFAPSSIDNPRPPLLTHLTDPTKIAFSCLSDIAYLFVHDFVLAVFPLIFLRALGRRHPQCVLTHAVALARSPSPHAGECGTINWRRTLDGPTRVASLEITSQEFSSIEEQVIRQTQFLAIIGPTSHVVITHSGCRIYH
ncbi:hypothetical protein BDP81DRAFT_103395 [Colletotrichum phormii]|uniref:Uncharacterized protein n=1 Tax=Colletotrichum phormii TaxID=359342 RepID=A0AAJ0ECT9_9PEZI|nr:uncharacterized protein BDP81DRAFT_103395 [Colletotrichum phormii]KAK1624947.1 hypothetical protein BDP81DRAFT_103395 [Colletotrichum phormii]